MQEAATPTASTHAISTRTSGWPSGFVRIAVVSPSYPVLRGKTPSGRSRRRQRAEVQVIPAQINKARRGRKAGGLKTSFIHSIADPSIGLLWRDFHPLEWQLASLYWSGRALQESSW